MDSVLNTLGAMTHTVKIILRVYDVTDIIFNGYNAHKHLDIQVTGGTRSWYIKVSKPNRSFCVDIGFLTFNDTFWALSRSNAVRTPCMGVSDVVDEKWIGIEKLYEKLYERAHRNWQESLKEYVSSPESLSGLAVSKK